MCIGSRGSRLRWHTSWLGFCSRSSCLQAWWRSATDVRSQLTVFLQVRIFLRRADENFRVDHNRLIVADQGSETVSAVGLKELRWVSWIPDEKRYIPFSCRTRSLMKKVDGMLTYNNGAATFTFSSAMSPQATGQSLVLYRGQEVIGGGVIASVHYRS